VGPQNFSLLSRVAFALSPSDAGIGWASRYAGIGWASRYNEAMYLATGTRPALAVDG
jgi:hypothetical protein